LRVRIALAVGFVAISLVGCAQASHRASAPVVEPLQASETPTSTPVESPKPLPDTSSLDQAAAACGISISHSEGHGYYSTVYEPNGGGVAVASLLFSRTMDKNIDGLLTVKSVDCFLSTFTKDVSVQTLKGATAASPYVKMWSTNGHTWNLSGASSDLMGQVMLGWLYE
jgi:hypothetical protein